MQFFTKNRVLTIGLIGTAVIALLIFLSVTDHCRSSPDCVRFFVMYRPWDIAAGIFITPFILFFSLTTYMLRPRIFEAWKRFVVWAVPPVVVGTYLISSMDSSGGGLGGPSIHPGLILLPLLYGTFFLISLIIIIVAWWRGRGKG